MHYRVATLSDLDEVTAAIQRLAAEQREYGSRIDPETNEEAFRARLAHQIVDGEVILAEDDDELVGVITISELSDGLYRSDCVGLIEYLYVAQPHRSKGIGATLLQQAEAALAERGMDVVELEVLALNEDALEFYRLEGFEDQRYRLAKTVNDEAPPQKEPE